MFSKIINDNELCSRYADAIFPNIRSTQDYRGDKSFTSTLRALLPTRLSEDEIIEVRIYADSLSESDIKDISADEFVTTYYGRRIGENRISICNIEGTDAGNTAAFKKIEESFTSIHKGFKELPVLHNFFYKQAYVRFYINEEIKSTVVIVGKLNIRAWHMIQSVISVIIPWWFKDKPITEEEHRLVASLTERSSDAYEELIAEFASKYDFRSAKIKESLKGVTVASYRNSLENTEYNIREKRNSLERNIAQYSQLMRELNELNIQHVGLTQLINNGGEDTELIEYFIRNKNIELVSAEDGRINIVAKTYLNAIDEEVFDSFYNNDSSIFYRGYEIRKDIFEDLAARKELINAIFGSERVLKLRLCGYYHLSLGSDVSTSSGYVYPQSCRNYIPNPHIQYHGCLGDYRVYMRKYLTEGDIVSAVEQCIASAGSVNLAETVSSEHLIWDLFGAYCDKKIIELPDGTECTPEEAYKYITEINKTEEESNG